jgi:hypothetical protein
MNDRRYLEAGGFILVAELVQVTDTDLFGSTTSRLELRLLDKLPRRLGVYAMVIGRLVMLVGKGDLVQRLRSYCRGDNATDRAWLHSQIGEALGNGDRIEILIYTDDCPLRRDNLPFDPISGLETALIKELAPPWNNIGNPTPCAAIVQARSDTATKAHASRTAQRPQSEIRA